MRGDFEKIGSFINDNRDYIENPEAGIIIGGMEAGKAIYNAAN
jgi:hypothetical protein